MAGEFKAAGDAIVTFLNGETFSQAFTAVRQNRVFHEEESTAQLSVYVFPIQHDRIKETRLDWRVIHTIGVGILKKIQATTDASALAEEDGLMALSDEIEQAIARQESIGGFFVEPTGFTARSPFSDAIARSGSFATVIQFTVSKAVV